MPKQVMPGLLGQVPQHAQVGVAGAAVVEHDLGGGEQHAHQEVPHHPAGGGEPEHAVALLGVQVQVHLLEVLEQDAALAVHDRLGQAGGARGVEHPQRVVEGQLRELQLGALLAQEAVRPAGARRGSRATPPARRSPPRCPPPPRGGRSPCRCSGSRPRPAAPSARSARSGRPPSGRRSPASSSTTPPRSTRRPGTRPSSRRCSACRPPRGRPARPPGPAGPRRSARPARAARPRSWCPARAARRRGGSPARVVLAAEDVLGVGEARAGEPLGARHLARPEHALVGRARPRPRRTPRSRPRSPRGRPPTTATASRSPRRAPRARPRASACSEPGWCVRCGLRRAPTAAARGRSWSRQGPYR